MKANDTQIRIFLEGTKQFMVPLFQRTYSWKKENIQKLWEDLKDTKNDKESTHFFGSFVTMPVPSSASGASQYTIIDGQQRLVTIFIFLAALRNRIIEINPEYEKKDEINELYLINKYRPEDKYKVVPTQADRNIFFTILNEVNPLVDSNHLIIETYRFFKNDKLSTINDLSDLVSLKDTLLSKFSVVDIRLENEDDPYLIFESLNATGTPLTQADLVRNYLFMRLNPNNQQNVYDKIWFPMQQNLQDHLEDFIRHYLAMGGNIPNYNKIYATFKDIADEKAKSEEDVIDIMNELLKYSEYYHTLLYPENESEELKRYFEKFDRLEVTTSYPLLLKLYDDYANKKLSIDDFAECLQVIETYIVRRAVCGIPTNVLNKYFPTIYNSLDQTNVPHSLKNKLKDGTGARRIPDNYEFKQCLQERKLFGRILQYLLEELERYNNKEVVDFEELQIEHIMPQTLSDEWKKELGSDWELTYQKYLDTLGNLTLTGYNPEYSNKLFIKKRDMKKGFKDSGLQLNRDLAELERWTEKEILDRATKLSGIGLEIWGI